MQIEHALNERSAYYSKEAAPNTTEHYHLLNTAEIVDHAVAAGYHLHSYQQKRVRKAEKYSFTKHIVRLRKPGQLVVNDIIPEIVIINSHDKSSSLKFMLGFFRVVCANGLITGDIFDSLGRILHNHNNPMEKVIENIDHIFEASERKLPLIKQMHETHLNADQQRTFVNRAATLLPSRIYENPMELNFINRYEDQAPTVWHTMNRVQENLLKGSAKIMGINGRLRKARSINGIDTNIDVNRKLWNIAESYLPMAA